MCYKVEGKDNDKSKLKLGRWAVGNVSTSLLREVGFLENEQEYIGGRIIR